MFLQSSSLPSLKRSRSHRSIFKEEFDPGRSTPYEESIRLGVMASPTPREVRRLASDHDFVLGAQSPRRLGWWAFLATHLSLLAAFGAGAICVIVAIVYTSTLSRKVLDCPTWATNCDKADGWTVENLGTVQGIITLIYFIGVASLAFVALALCETAIWPLLTRQSFSIGQLEAFQSATRGSVLSVPAAAMSVRSLAAGMVLLAAVATTLIPLASAPLVGFAHTPTWEPVNLESSYSSAGGISDMYAQTAPPTSIIAGVLAEYHAWSMDPSSEPLSEYRDWYVDRETLGQRGDLSANAIKLDTSITCAPYKTRQLQRDGMWWNAFMTNMTRTNTNSSVPGDKNSSAEVWVRGFPQLTLWADDFSFPSPDRTRTTLVFAALNGTIDNGLWTPFIHPTIAGSSAIACDVDINAVDGMLTVGNPPSVDALPTLSSISTLQLSAAPGNTALNELLLWFTIAPLLAAPSVDGAQPLFSNSTTTSRPIPFTGSSPLPGTTNAWTTEGITTFIRIAIGALAQTTSSPHLASTDTTTTTLTTSAPVQKLSPSRALLLIILPVLILTIAATVATWSTLVHKREGIPVMRMMGMAEVLKSAQTRYLRDQAATDAAKTYLPSELGAKVRGTQDLPPVLLVRGGDANTDALPEKLSTQ
ncbi:hypothetical protein QBC34DRAFT_496828 [Podospora aff. communis PSN243]|uniref:Uncharacterized protein n=1 Tax=Podospora aff. communis PSN243 TaxID=3040156 RepID=A0AAV9GGL8_9PEZI|nr:hypothetical protein QBC34DRAFT_496828 [Podospora aff. communis PSN243]